MGRTAVVSRLKNFPTRTRRVPTRTALIERARCGQLAARPQISRPAHYHDDVGSPGSHLGRPSATLRPSAGNNRLMVIPSLGWRSSRRTAIDPAFGPVRNAGNDTLEGHHHRDSSRAFAAASHDAIATLLGSREPSVGGSLARHPASPGPTYRSIAASQPGILTFRSRALRTPRCRGHRRRRSPTNGPDGAPIRRGSRS